MGVDSTGGVGTRIKTRTKKAIHCSVSQVAVITHAGFTQGRRRGGKAGGCREGRYELGATRSRDGTATRQETKEKENAWFRVTLL